MSEQKQAEFVSHALQIADPNVDRLNLPAFIFPAEKSIYEENTTTK